VTADVGPAVRRIRGSAKSWRENRNAIAEPAPRRHGRDVLECFWSSVGIGEDLIQEGGCSAVERPALSLCSCSLAALSKPAAMAMPSSAGASV
jgi:hypothetical protein